jgi:hypothetical protein
LTKHKIDGAHLAIGALALVSLGAAVARAGSRNEEHWAFTTLTGDEVFAHVTRPAAAASILKQGFRAGSGWYGTGVYLLPPEEEWGGGLPPSRIPAQQFRLLWHGQDPLSVLRVRLPAGTRLLRVGQGGSRPDVVLDAYNKLEGKGGYRAARQRRPAWEDRDVARDALLADLAAKHRIDGLYVMDIFGDSEVLILDPSKIEVLREQMQRQSQR